MLVNVTLYLKNKERNQEGIMSFNGILFAVVAGFLTFIMGEPTNPINPFLITNILLGLIAGQLIDKRKS